MTTPRSKPTFHILLFFALLASLLGSAFFVTPAHAAGITVTSSSDTSADDGTCTLREAIANANGDSQLFATSGECASGSGTDTISFDPSLSGATIYLQSTLSITTNLTIDGSALTSQITISGDSDQDTDGDVRVFSVSSGATATLNGLTIEKGTTSGLPGGGGIYNDLGSALTITNSTIADNRNSSGPGGGIRNDGALTVTNSTISGNTATTSGGGIRNIGALTVTNSTFSGNSAATGSGGGIYNVAGFTSVTITNSTFSGNSAGSQGGGIYTAGGTFNYANTIIANSTSGGDCGTDGTVGTNINNLVEDGSCSASVTGDPNLGSLADNGGPTQTFALLTGSSAIDAGNNTTCAASPVNNLDQRGTARPQHMLCDIGAYENEYQPIVTKLADTNDGVCDSDCSLREAIATAVSYQTIIFDSSLSGGTIHLGSTLNIVQNMTIDGSALASKITVSGDSDSDGDGDVRVFFVHSGITVTLDSLIITKGNGSAASLESLTGGGGIQSNTGNNPGWALTVKNSVIYDNSADKGGGIYNANNSTLTVTNSTISNNTATNGGGIYTDGSLLTITDSTISGNAATGGDGGGIRSASILPLTNSTISGNSATGSGGGIWNDSILTLTNSTISGNSAGVSGGGVYSSNFLNYANTIIANSITNSVAGGDCTGDVGINTNNLVEYGGCSSPASGDPMLDSLADNGGPTLTLALVLGSPAIDAGDDTTCTNSPVNGLDQRGVTRPVGASCDIGAYEGAKDITVPTVTSFTATSPSTSLNIPITAFTASDNVAVTGYKITETATAPSAGAAGWTGSFPSTHTVGSDGSYTLYPWAKDADGNVSAVYGSPVSVTVDTTAPTVVSVVRFDSNPTNASTVNYKVIFSEEVTGVFTSDFSVMASGLSGASILAIDTSDNINYSVAVDTGSGDGTLRLDVLDDDGITDNAGNTLNGPGNNDYTNGETYTVDKTGPTVSSSLRANSNPTNAASVNFTVTFSEAVTGVDVTDFTLTTTGIASASISAVSGSGASYTVTASTGSGNGTLRLDIPNTASISDAGSNSLTNLPFTSGETYNINKAATFSDVPMDYWAWRYIESLYNSGITGGCSTNPLSYCPTSSVTRAQMAVFLLKGIHGFSFTPPAVNGSTGFSDVATDYWAAAWIKQLAAEGITGGCGNGNYCPENTVTRDQMAIFLLKAKYGSSYAPPAVGADTGFTDVPADYWAAAWIKQLAAEAITGGCGGGLYCPVNPVTRDQMAVFLQKTFGLPLP